MHVLHTRTQLVQVTPPQVDMSLDRDRVWGLFICSATRCDYCLCSLVKNRVGCLLNELDHKEVVFALRSELPSTSIRRLSRTMLCVNNGHRLACSHGLFFRSLFKRSTAVGKRWVLNTCSSPVCRRYGCEKAGNCPFLRSRPSSLLTALVKCTTLALRGRDGLSRGSPTEPLLGALRSRSGEQ